MQLRPTFGAGRDRKGDRTRERIFQAALGEFRENGFEAASIGQIARRAGTSRASFYFYFPSKDAVLLDLQWRVETEVIERTRDAAGLRAFLAGLVDALCEADTGICDGGLLRIMLGIYIRRPAELDLADQPFPLMMEIGRRFAAGRESELRPGLDPALATDLFLSALFGLIAGTAGPVAERRSDLAQLTALFLADEALERR
jgi:TetR/AcrR family transcriptional regulator, repressor for uid operon